MIALNRWSKGSGALFLAKICDTAFGAEVRCDRVYHWNDHPLYDLCWSEVEPNVVWTVSGDGLIQIWHLSSPEERPIHVIKGHDSEIYSTNWSLSPQEAPHVLTTSSDSSVKIWDALTCNIIQTHLGHQKIVYCGQWSSSMAHTFATTSGDSTLKIWSLKQMESTLTIKASFGTISALVRSNDCKPLVPFRRSLVLRLEQSETIRCDHWWCQRSDPCLGYQSPSEPSLHTFWSFKSHKMRQIFSDERLSHWFRVLRYDHSFMGHKHIEWSALHFTATQRFCLRVWLRSPNRRSDGRLFVGSIRSYIPILSAIHNKKPFVNKESIKWKSYEN